ncbi:MAG TPA: exopolysaccharide Pel transporter PelG, partial [Candidatus Omnitrophota bacterium]|nr:exopolysaccharide Pel transporter PelG [Candidatus Omnitrophota bacterium]
MAGIGFNLQKILSGDTYFDSVKAHLYSVLISAGPWVLSIITLFCLSLFVPENIDTFELIYFRTSIIYVYAFSLIGAGLVQLVLTRYLADKLYLKEKEALVPAFNSSAIVLLAVQSLAGGFYVFLGDEALPLRLSVFLIYLTVSMIWLVMTLLSALYDYKAIVFIYTLGSAVTVAGAWGLGTRMGLIGYFFGYLIGHLLIMILLSARVFIEFPSDRKFDWGFLRFLCKNWTLVLIGVVYNLAIWIDKIVFWFSPNAVEVSRLLRTYPAYESAVFFAYLTIIPSLSFFLLEIETSFYKSYRSFFMEILEKGTYPSIEKRKLEIQKTLSRSMGFLVKYQGLISLLFITSIPNIEQLPGMQWVEAPV